MCIVGPYQLYDWSSVPQLEAARECHSSI